MAKELRGYCPIMPTAYARDGTVDLASMRGLTELLVASGAQGMSPNGGDSEARYLTEDERKRVLDVVVDANAGRTPVLVGASAPTTAESARLGRHAQAAGADAVFVMPPANWTATLLEPAVPDDEMLAHYEAVSAGFDIPLMIHATAAMSVAFFDRLLAAIPTVRYVKEETTHGPKLRQYVRALSDRVAVFGPGTHFPAELEWGAAGVMPSCCAPRAHAQVFDLWQQGRRDEARREWRRLLPLVHWRWRTAPKEAGKTFLMHLGVFETAFTRPDFGALALDEADRQEMLQVLADMGEPPY